ncbi:MAG TPA: alpha-L-fucosidase [Tepidisphaeraceae bacterium]|nr:alpha-L-fucosidase [Tepidisphaeraceae bacterium]
MRNSSLLQLWLAIACTTLAVAISARAQTQPNLIAAGGNAKNFDMAPETRLDVVEAAVAAIPDKLPPGPVQPDWDSIKAHYQAPAWFSEAKFGLFMHWGLYSVPAYHNEWYEKHMYASLSQWHREHFGPQDVFGYKDFIPKFTQEKFDPDAWAELFKKSGAKYVIPTAQHHDNFAMWDSAVTPFNAKQMGPKRDLIGDLAKAVRARGLKFGVSNHGIENFQFINPTPELAADLKTRHADLYDPKWADFYHVADRSDDACKKFLVNWAQRNVELIDKYQPDILWFDNGVDIRYLDPLKLWVAAYYYDRAAQWGKDVSISTKKAAFSPSDDNTQTIGSILDFEKIGPRSPTGIRKGCWQVDEPIGSTWGYTSDMRISAPGVLIEKLVDTVSKNGNLLLNLSPKSDGTIPREQQETLLEIGKWLDINGEAIYGTHSWIKFGESAGRNGGELNLRFTAKPDALYAILIGNWPKEQVEITSLGSDQNMDGKITSVTMLGHDGLLDFTQDAGGLKIKLPNTAPCQYAYILKITGLKMNPPTTTESGNPQ